MRSGAVRSGGQFVIETDPYSILGVARGCTPEEAREAYRAGVRATHPDHGGDGAAFIRLCEAYRQVVAELEHPAKDQADPPQSGSGSGLGPASAPGTDRRAYVAWVREHARNSSRQRSRSHSHSRSRGRRRRSRDERPWWRRHPRAARAILFGLVAAFGLSILGFTLILGPGLIERAERRARERSRARTAPPSSRAIAEVPAARPNSARRDGPRDKGE